MAYLTIEGKALYYEHHIGGDVCVVLSHGYGMSCRAWDGTMAVLANHGFSVLAYDHRCCGQSDKDFADVSVEALGSDVAALCDHLGLAKVVLNGWSLGGAIVVDAAPRLGDRLLGLISTGGATPRYTQADGFPHGGTAEDVAATVAALQADRINFLQGLYFEGVFAAPVSDAVKQFCWQIALQASSAADASLGALAQIDQRDTLASLSCPSLFLVGTNDGVVPADIGRFAAQHAQNGQLVEIADCGHAPFLEQAGTYHTAVIDFLEQL